MHSPGSGVKVYVVVTVLSIAGDHVPDTPSSLTEGKLKARHIYNELTRKVGSVSVGALTTTVFPTEQPVLSITTAVYIPAAKLESVFVFEDEKDVVEISAPYHHTIDRSKAEQIQLTVWLLFHLILPNHKIHS